MDVPPERFAHVFLTRFNVRVVFGDDSEINDDEWLRSRLALFLALTVPSVAAQTRPSPWIVFFDSESPSWFRDEIARHPVITPVFVEGELTDSRIRGYVHDSGLNTREYLMTTRIDSDDAIRLDFTEQLARLFRPAERTFIEFPRGLQIADGRVYRRLWRSNPFLTLIEPGAGRIPTTVFCKSHNEVVGSESVITSWRADMWAQSIHGANNSSVLSATSPKLTPGLPRTFRVDPALHLRPSYLPAIGDVYLRHIQKRLSRIRRSLPTLRR